MCLPGLQAPAEPHDLGERRLCAEGAGREPQLDPAQGAGGAQHGRPRRRRTPTPTALGRRATARLDRAPSSTIRRCSSATSRLESLDPDTSVGIMQLLYRINRSGTTVVMATHDREMVDKMRRRVIALEDGRIARDERRGATPRMRLKMMLIEAVFARSGQCLDHGRGDVDRPDRDVPARALHRLRELRELLERPRQEGARRQGLLRPRDANRRTSRPFGCSSTPIRGSRISCSSPPTRR